MWLTMEKFLPVLKVSGSKYQVSDQLGPAEDIHIYYTGNAGFPQNNLVAVKRLQLFV